MPANAKELERVARKLGFKKVRQKGSHARWQHLDGRATTIPTHVNAELVVGCFMKFSSNWVLQRKNLTN